MSLDRWDIRALTRVSNEEVVEAKLHVLEDVTGNPQLVRTSEVFHFGTGEYFPISTSSLSNYRSRFGRY
jgi:hypothetical protein